MFVNPKSTFLLGTSLIGVLHASQVLSILWVFVERLLYAGTSFYTIHINFNASDNPCLCQWQLHCNVVYIDWLDLH